MRVVFNGYGEVRGTRLRLCCLLKDIERREGIAFVYLINAVW